MPPRLIGAWACLLIFAACGRPAPIADPAAASQALFARIAAGEAVTAADYAAYADFQVLVPENSPDALTRAQFEQGVAANIERLQIELLGLDPANLRIVKTETRDVATRRNRPARLVLLQLAAGEPDAPRAAVAQLTWFEIAPGQWKLFGVQINRTDPPAP